MVRLEKGLPIMTELLSHGSDRVVRAMSGAMRNLSMDARNRELLGVCVRESGEHGGKGAGLGSPTESELLYPRCRLWAAEVQV